MTSSWFSAHSHSQFSVLDGMTPVPDMVAKAAAMGQPALGLTDHGGMAGMVQLYKACKAHDILPFMGVEAYLMDPQDDTDVSSKDGGKIKRYHLGLLAANLNGYRGLMRLVNTSYTRPRFNRFPRFTMDDLAELSEDAGDDIILMTGCFFGLAQQTLVNDGPTRAKNVVRMYASMFPHTFVEVQHHSICHDEEETIKQWDDDDIVTEMVGIADSLGLPLIATQDSHYLDQGDKVAHELMKRMAYGGTDPEFPGDSFHLASGEWVSEHYQQGVWDMVEQGAEHMLSLHGLTVPALDTYKAHVPALVKDPLRKIKSLCMDTLADYPLYQKTPAKYEERLLHELAVLKDLDMAGYVMLVRNYVEWCADKGICIEARGSANASLLCFLLGITQVDPLEWGLDEISFSRFLSRDRIKPPDIDMDIEDVARERLIGYLQRTFDTTRIGTWSRMGVREDGKGSVLVSYKSYLTRDIKDKAEKQRIFATVQTVDDVQGKDSVALKRIGKMDVYRSYGVHAGGILLSGSDQRIDEYVPRMLVASSNMEVSQFDMDDVEQLGYLKLDILGQTILTVMRRCQELIGLADPTDFTWMPKNDTEACKILREGRTDNGIFHFEGYTKAKGGKRMGIKTTMDAVLAQGLFMPGAMDTGQTELYLARRKLTVAERKAKVKFIHPVFESALKDTHGAVVFQEQVIHIMRGFGMSVGSINTLFKIVKDSGAGAEARNAKRLGQIRAEFDTLTGKAGLTAAQSDKAWQSTAGFAAYGFNRAHATGYGIRAYRGAYLKAHHPLEYMTALLESWAGTDKETLYIRECRRMGIRILPPDIQAGSTTWVMDKKRNAIRRGLTSIKGVGQSAAEELATNAPFASVTDIIERTTVTGGKSWAKDRTLNGVLKILDDQGLLANIIDNDKEVTA